MLPLHQAALVDSVPPKAGEPSSHSQCDTLPDKLEPTFVIEDRFELSSPMSETGMLPLHHSTICGSYENRTHSF